MWCNKKFKRFTMRAFVFFLLIISNCSKAFTGVVHYDLHITDTTLYFNGKSVRAIAVNGQVPMPTLVFTEGDTAEISVFNHLTESTSLHWHGVFLPNAEDGVPFLTQLPIEPGATYTYRFPVIQNGTHWYHSHSGLQEQIGMYGMLIFNKRSDDAQIRTGIDDIQNQEIILSEWTTMHPNYIHHLLRGGSDWFTIKKHAAQSYAEAIGNHALGVKLSNEWKRMNAMDVSDVFYDDILVNGQTSFQLLPADSLLRLRIANGSASTYYWLSYAGGQVMVIANDGNDVEPVEVDRMLIAVSETYDIIVKIPTGHTYEFLVMSEDRSQSASIWLGSGDTIFAYKWPKLSYFEGMKMMNGMMRMNGTMDAMGMRMGMQVMDMNEVMYPELNQQENVAIDHIHEVDEMQNTHTIGFPQTLNYSMLKATTNTAITGYDSIKTLHFTLTGNMQRYVWSINGKVVSEADKILIHKNELVRIVLTNNSMMRHPMHLHGHDFRILNGQGNYAPLKNVLDIMPMETDTIEFLANADGDWYFHCHLLYHMMSGMGRVFTIEDDTDTLRFIQNAYSRRKFYNEDKALHFMADGFLANNGSHGMAMIQNTRWQFSADWMVPFNPHPTYESEIHLGRFIGSNQWFMPYIGLMYKSGRFGHDETMENIFGQNIIDRDPLLPAIGFTYLIPFNFTLQSDIMLDGSLRVQLMRDDIPITPRLKLFVMGNTDMEYEVGLKYVIKPYLGLSVNYGNMMGAGAGLSFTY